MAVEQVAIDLVKPIGWEIGNVYLPDVYRLDLPEAGKPVDTGLLYEEDAFLFRLESARDTARCSHQGPVETMPTDRIPVTLAVTW